MAFVTLQTIFQDAFPTYEQRHALPTHVRRAAHALMQCRTAALGGPIQACPDGHVCRPSCHELDAFSRLRATAPNFAPAAIPPVYTSPVVPIIRLLGTTLPHLRLYSPWTRYHIMKKTSCYRNHF